MQKKTRIKGLVTLVVGVVLIGLFALVFLTKNKDVQASGDTGNLVSLSIKPGATVHDTLELSGALSGGYFFEAQARGMILDSNKKVLTSFPLISTSFWMTEAPVGFAARINVSSLPKGAGYIRLANADPKGTAVAQRTIDIPVVIK